MGRALTPAVGEDVGQVLTAVRRLQREWPGEVQLQLHAKDSAYNAHSYLFRQAFPDVPSAVYQRLSQAALLISGAVVLRDELMDEVDVSDVRRSLLRIQAMEYEGLQIWHELFPSGSGFWHTYRRLVSDYARVNLEAKRFATGELPWSRFSVDFATELARCNAGLACSTIAALAELSSAKHHREPLIESVHHYNVARQFWDDVCDWKDDLRRGQPSLVLARAHQARPDLAARQQQGEPCREFTREVYYSGHLTFVLELALEHIDAAERSLTNVPRLDWHDLLGILRGNCIALLEDVNRIVDRNLQVAATGDVDGTTRASA